MEIDTRMILTLAGMLASVVSAFVIVKQKLANVIEHNKDVEARLRNLDKSTDNQEIVIEKNTQRLDVMSTMLAPKEREARGRGTASMKAELNSLRKEVDKLSNMHNGKHPPPT